MVTDRPLVSTTDREGSPLATTAYSIRRPPPSPSELMDGSCSSEGSAHDIQWEDAADASDDNDASRPSPLGGATVTESSSSTTVPGVWRPTTDGFTLQDASSGASLKTYLFPGVLNDINHAQVVDYGQSGAYAILNARSTNAIAKVCRADNRAGSCARAVGSGRGERGVAAAHPDRVGGWCENHGWRSTRSVRARRILPRQRPNSTAHRATTSPPRQVNLSTGALAWQAGGAGGTLTLVDLDGATHAPGGEASLWHGQHNGEYFGAGEYYLFDNNYNVSSGAFARGDGSSRLLIVSVDEVRGTQVETTRGPIRSRRRDRIRTQLSRRGTSGLGV